MLFFGVLLSVSIGVPVIFNVVVRLALLTVIAGGGLALAVLSVTADGSIIRRFGSDFRTEIFAFVDVVVFGLYFLSLVITTGAVDCGGMCAIVVIVVHALLSLSPCAVDCGAVCAVDVIFGVFLIGL